MYKHPDIVVVGVGRSATSFVAATLHVHYNVLMATSWHPPSEFQPEGSYEDMKMILHSYEQVEVPNSNMDKWLEKYTQLFSNRDHKIVGIKQTPLSLLSREKWKVLDPRLVIRTHRPRDLTVESMFKWRTPKNLGYWRDFYDQREEAMQNNLDWGHEFPVLRIQFGKSRMKESELYDILGPWIKRFYNGSI